MTEIGGFTLSEWREMPWWPTGHKARITAGFAGHDREIVVNIDGYGHGRDETLIEEYVAACFTHFLPESWKVENRGSRIEVHPSGRFAGGYHPADLEATKSALEQIGLVVAEVRDDKA